MYLLQSITHNEQYDYGIIRVICAVYMAMRCYSTAATNTNMFVRLGTRHEHARHAAS